MNTLIFHNANFLDYMISNSLGKTTVTLVASVEDVPGAVGDIAQMDRAFTLTNNIDIPWPNNPGVKCAETGPYRSTSVGDLMQRGSKIYVVESIGFREISREEECNITFHSTGTFGPCAKP